MSTVDTVLQALANRRRRLAVYCLSEHRSMTLADLAEQVVESEGTELHHADAEQTADVYFSLYHTHVPTLEDAGLVSYSQQRDLVSSTEQLRPLILEAQKEVQAIVSNTP